MMQLSLLDLPAPTPAEVVTVADYQPPLNPHLTFTEVHSITTAEAIANDHPLLPIAYREWRWLPLIGQWVATGSVGLNPARGNPDGTWFPWEFDPRMAQRLPEPTEPIPEAVESPGLQVGDWVIRSGPIAIATGVGQRVTVREFYPFGNTPGRISQIVGDMAWVEHRHGVPPYPHSLKDLELGGADDEW
jgi:hypothetical protein